MQDTTFSIVLVCQELTRPGQLRRALAALPAGSRRHVRLTTFTPRALRDAPDEIEAALETADLLLLSHVLVDDDARRVDRLLTRALPERTHVLVLNSLRSVLARGRLGNLRFSELLAGAASGGGPPLPPAFRALLTDADMTAALRTFRGELPELVKRLPEPMRDVRSFVEACLYWAEPSPANLAHLMLRLADLYGPAAGSLASSYAPPALHPDVGLYHPACGLAEDVTALPDHPATRGTIGLLLMRGAVLAGETRAPDAVIEAFEARGYRVVPCFSESFDFRPAIERFCDPFPCDAIVSMTGFPLVGGHNRCEVDETVPFLAERGVPYFTPPGLMVQDIAAWERSRLGLAPMEVAMELAISELEGGLEPVVLQGADPRAEKGLVPDRLPRLVDRVDAWRTLALKSNADKRVLVTVFSFPPGKGSVGTAAYLDVMRSVHELLTRLAEAGYRVDVPETPQELLERVVHGDDKTAPIHSADLAVGDRLSVADYERVAPASRRVEKMWGPAPGALNSDGRDLLVHGVSLGNVFVGVQPSFGYEGDPMRLLFDRGATPHHGFLAYYRWAEEIFGADAIVHVGTHGALEFMPGKQTGLSADCWPDILAGKTPILYLYAVNNPSEGTIAKRRGNAVTISHLTPPTDRAGLYHELEVMKGLIAESRAASPGPARDASVASLVALVEKHSLDVDVPLPTSDDDTATDTFLGALWVCLQEIESRRIPVGLHTLGRSPERIERIEILAGIAEHDRFDDDVQALPATALRARGLDPAEVRAGARAGREDDVRRLAALSDLTREVVGVLLDEGTAAATDEATRRLDDVAPEDIRPLFELLAHVDGEMDRSDEITPLLDGLGGRYIEPGAGGDPVRNPAVLPSGRNLHALDPGSIPSPSACRRADEIVALLLERCRLEEGRIPRSIGMVLWGLDNIKTQGEAVAQAFALLGVRPRPNSIGRMTELEVISLEELGRPRIDVVISASGIFRDVFGLQMSLLDRAVRLVAALDEPATMNPVRARVAELVDRGFDGEQAASRVFSNAPGAYGTNIDHMVNLSTWNERSDLARIFAKRKAFAFGADVEGERAEEVLQALAEGIETTFQNIDSSEVSITDVDHYFEYLGGLTALVEERTGVRPPVLVADGTSAVTKVRALDETIRLETRTKLLNPKWYEGLMRHGYEGVEEIRKRFEYTFGWSATCDAVDPWIYREVHRTYVDDADLAGRMQEANVDSYHALVRRLLEADARGFWEPTPEERATLETAAADVEDAIEGVV